ncbi:MAG: signal peptidase II [Candidatus Omnitrophica bacterium]|nr:signal peptidase II [Candidatus Omnitrophota bacterium]
MTYRFRPYIFLTAAVIFAADRLSKYLAAANLDPGESVRVISGIFHITLVLNNGAAFGIFKSGAGFFIVFSIAAIALMMFFIMRSHTMDVITATAFAFILGGASGNLVDRLKFGYVIDFLDFRVWPVFNIADSAITIGVILLALAMFLKRP